MEKTEKNEPVCYCGTLMKDHKGMGDCNSPREMEEVTYERPYTPPRPSPTEECKRLEKENEDLLKRCIELESIRTARMERLEEACRVARLAMTPKYNPEECRVLDAVLPVEDSRTSCDYCNRPPTQYWGVQYLCDECPPRGDSSGLIKEE